MPSHLLIQLSDVHLTTGGTLPPGIRPRDSLLTGLRLLDSAGRTPDTLLGATDGGAGPINQTHWHNGLRVIALDSTVPGAGHGHLEPATLDYLRAEPRTPAPDGTVVALHHPPIPTPIEPMARIALRNPHDLRAAITGTDVRIVLCGHNHHPALGTLDVTSTRAFRGVPGGALSRIDLFDTGPVATGLPIDPA